MATDTQNDYRQVYNATDDGKVLSGIHHVTCILVRRGLLAASFNATNELLSIHYAGYNKNRPVWELDFFEPLFSQEPLLTDHEKITKIFFCSAQNLVVPAELYDPTEAENWLKKIHYVDTNDEVQHFYLKEDKSNYLYSIPVNIKALVKINCPMAPLLPLPVYQFSSNYTRGVRLHCFLSGEQASVTIYHYGTLLWHRVFDYTAAEDIAYEIRLICEEHKINADKISIACTALSAAEYPVTSKLSQYFGGATTGGGHTINSPWACTLSLIKQLETCA